MDPLPAAVTDWVRDAVGSDARTVHAHEMNGATTSEVVAIDVDRAHDATVHLVLRRYVNRAVLESEPDPVAREIAVLGALEASRVSAPRAIAADPDGSVCGDPLLLMTRLHGKPRWRAREGVFDFLDQLALQLPMVHEVVPYDPSFPSYQPYRRDPEDAPPSWSRHPDAWTTALELHASPLPPFDPVLIHRDYHPGNVLWNGNVVSGVVDWAWGCCGPPEVDVAHCRLNLALHIDADAADLFLTAWETHAGVYTYDAGWDLRDAVDMLPDLGESHAALERLDELVARSAASLGSHAA